MALDELLDAVKKQTNEKVPGRLQTSDDVVEDTFLLPEDPAQHASVPSRWSDSLRYSSFHYDSVTSLDPCVLMTATAEQQEMADKVAARYVNPQGTTKEFQADWRKRQQQLCRQRTTSDSTVEAETKKQVPMSASRSLKARQRGAKKQGKGRRNHALDDVGGFRPDRALSTSSKGSQHVLSSDGEDSDEGSPKSTMPSSRVGRTDSPEALPPNSPPGASLFSRRRTVTALDREKMPREGEPRSLSKKDFAHHHTGIISSDKAAELSEVGTLLSKRIAQLSDHQPQSRTSSKDAVGENFNLALALARKHSLPLEQVRKEYALFSSFDTEQTGLLSYTLMQDVLRLLCHMGDDDEFPEHLLKSAWCEPYHPGVEFEEFLLWVNNISYAEEILVTDPRERKLRHLARVHGFELPAMEQIKATFSRFDKDGSGSIEEAEFKAFILMLLKVPDPSLMSERKLQRYWRELDFDGSGEVSFEEFLVWYYTKFDEGT